jgi:UDP-N-acetylmuramoyl-L-alanyl-D-glutamate--2,6-diaminopimelate ligase
MKLTEIQVVVEAARRPESPPGDPEVTGLAHDSREVAPGDLFFCIRGSTDDGHRRAEQAASAGAVAVVSEAITEAPLPHLLVTDVRSAMNRAAAHFHGNPGAALGLIGVTGTNGKTTTAFMTRAIMEAAGMPTGLIGTIEVRFGEFREDGVRTTPDGIQLHRILGEMARLGAGSCVMEVTSHGIDQRRIEGLFFQTAVFTNLSQDHLDYHPTMEDYYQTKRGLFSPEWTAVGVVNLDDEWGARLAEEARIPTVTYGMAAGRDLWSTDVHLDARGSRFRITGLFEVEVALSIPGWFNVSNAVAAAAAAHLAGADPDAIRHGLATLDFVPGRFERVDEGQDFTVIVDYAHTPEGLSSALAAAKTIGRRVIAVFGCGGDRDRSKRPLMGRAASAHADVVIVTSDNPRGENPEEIIAEVEVGVEERPPPGGYRLIPDRAEAIAVAISQAAPGDVVLIAGKGHESYQEFADRTVPFDDRAVAAAALRRQA